MIRSNRHAKALEKHDDCIEPEITAHETAVFFTIVLYMGILKCLDKDEYCSTHEIMPIHPIKGYMTRSRFRYIWRHIHLESENSNVDGIWFKKVYFLVEPVRTGSAQAVSNRD